MTPARWRPRGRAPVRTAPAVVAAALARPHRVVVFAAVVLALAAATATAQGSAGEAQDGEIDAAAATGEAAGRVRYVAGRVAVVIDQAELGAIGVATAPLAAASRPVSFEAFARVVDVAPLLQGRADHDLSRAAEAVAQVQMDTARAEYQRLRDLGERGRLITQQELQLALGEFQRFQALVQAEQVRQARIADQLANAFSPTLADAVLGGDEALYGALVNRSRQLLQVTLPAGRTLPADPSGIELLLPARGGDRHIAARFTSAAPATDPRIQGETWYYTVPGDGIRTGMRLTALVADDQTEEQGTFVPESAVVWHDGRPWLYVALERGVFARRDLSDAAEVAGGWFAPRSVVRPGEEAVVAGATTLLSEEYRWQIPEEDDDDDG